MPTPAHCRMALFAAACALSIASAQPNANWVSLFDGKSIDNWVVKGGSAKYHVEDGMIVGTTVDKSKNTFLCTKRDYADFELELMVRCDKELNSGIQIRSHGARAHRWIETRDEVFLCRRA